MSKSARSEKRQEKQVKHKSAGSAPSKFFNIKAKRCNYYVGEKNNELDTAVSVWTKKTGRVGDSNGKQCLLQVFYGVVGIP